MALPILDGNQSATTLSTILSGGEHTPAHTVVSLGSTAISNITSAVSGSVVSVSNFPATQTIAGTVTANAAEAVSIVNSTTITKADAKFSLIAGASNPTDVAQGYSITPLDVDIKGVAFVDGKVVSHRSSCVAELTGQGGPAWKATLVASSVTISNSVTIGSLPSISGTVTVGNFPATQTIAGTVTIGNSVTIGSLPSISGTVTANINGTVPISISSVTIGNSVTIASFATSVTARLINPAGTAVTYAEIGTAGNPSIDVLSVQGVSGGTNLPIAGSVTISGVPNGALTTRFGSVTTANTAQISSAVTNTARRYLLIQNVTTSSNVITVGVGFTPTTTQGIQLAAGAGITFESSYIPTGAVYILSSVTASPFTILEA